MKPRMEFVLELFEAIADWTVRLLPLWTLIAGSLGGWIIARWRLKKTRAHEIRARAVEIGIEAFRSLNMALEHAANHQVVEAVGLLREARALVDMLPDSVKPIDDQYMVAIEEVMGEYKIDDADLDPLIKNAMDKRVDASKALRDYNDSDS